MLTQFNIDYFFPVIIIFLLLLGFNVCGKSNNNFQDQGRFFLERKKMVDYQIKNRGIKNPKVLDAFYKVERHNFVPNNLEHYAYADRPLPIGEGQTISQPYIVAYMTEILNLQKDDKVLEIGTGSGYQAAILAELCDSVFSIEINKTLGERAEKLLDKLGYTNIHVRIGDGYKGWPEEAPFDAVIVTCAPNNVPEPLKEQLKEGGRMIIPVGNSFSQRLVYLIKEKNKLKQFDSLPVIFVPMIDSTGSKH